MKSKQAESTLLAIIIQGGQSGVGNQLLSEAEESGITAECFTDHNCQTIWEVCKEVEAKGRPVEETEILTSAQVKGMDMVEFLNIMEFVKSPINLATYAEKVLEFHKLRMLTRMSRLVQEQVGEGLDAGDIMTTVDATTKKLAESGSTQQTIGDAFDSFIRDLFGDFDEQAYIPTGINSYDKTLKRGGFGPSQLCVLAARPGCGKTATALNIVHRAAKKGIPMGIFPLEMSTMELMGRMGSMESGIPWDQWKVQDQKKVDTKPSTLRR